MKFKLALRFVQIGILTGLALLVKPPLAHAGQECMWVGYNPSDCSAYVCPMYSATLGSQGYFVYSCGLNGNDMCCADYY
jgi:hypothetical protein